MSIRPYGSRWRVFVEAGYDDFGKRKRDSQVCTTYEEAKGVETDLRHEVRHGKRIEPSSESVAAFCDRYLDQRTGLAPATLTRYRGMVETHIRPTLKHTALSKFTPKVAAAWQAKQLASGLSTTTVRKHAILLSAAMDKAVSWGMLAVNPMHLLDTPANAHSQIRALSLSEQAALLTAAATAKGTGSYHKGRCEGHLYVPVALALATGLRRGELLALRWQDVEGGRLHVARAACLDADRRTVYGPGKTRAARRVVSLPDSVTALLSDLRRDSRHHRSGIVLLTQDGTPWTLDGFAAAWKRLRNRAADKHMDSYRQSAAIVDIETLDDDETAANLRRARFHDLRHTHATELLRAGVHIKVVSERLGHASIAVTADRYSHVAPDMGEAAAAAIDAQMKGLLV